MKTWDVAIEGIQKIPEKVVRGTVLGMFSRIVKRSPVKSGRFRGNWQITIDSRATGELAPDKTGNQTISAAASIAQGQRFPASAYFISNNLPYGEKLELGSSQQAPNGMVRISVAEFERVIREEAAKL